MNRDPFSPRKAGRQSRARETTEAIIQACAQILARHGITRLTTNHVAELAGVSIGSLYQYFPGKDALLHAVIEREFSAAVDGVVATVEAIDPTRDSLDDAIRTIVDRVFDNQVKLRPVYREILLAAVSFKHLRFTLDNDARVLRAVREKLAGYPEVSREGLELATFVVLHAIKGVQLGAVFNDRSQEDPRLRALVVRLARACLVDERRPCRAVRG